MSIAIDTIAAQTSVAPLPESPLRGESFAPGRIMLTGLNASIVPLFSAAPLSASAQVLPGMTAGEAMDGVVVSAAPACLSILRGSDCAVIPYSGKIRALHIFQRRDFTPYYLAAAEENAVRLSKLGVYAAGREGIPEPQRVSFGRISGVSALTSASAGRFLYMGADSLARIGKKLESVSTLHVVSIDRMTTEICPPVLEFAVFAKRITALAATSHPCRTLALGFENGRLQLRRLLERGELAERTLCSVRLPSRASVTAIAFADRSHVVAGDELGNIFVIDTERPEEEPRPAVQLAGGGVAVRSLAVELLDDGHISIHAYAGERS